MGAILAVLLAIGAIGLGIKAFTAEGLPLTNRKHLTGPVGKLLGVLCFLVAAAALCAVLLWV